MSALGNISQHSAKAILYLESNITKESTHMKDITKQLIHFTLFFTILYTYAAQSSPGFGSSKFIHYVVKNPALHNELLKVFRYYTSGMEDGSLRGKEFTIRYNEANGYANPAKRFHPSVDLGKLNSALRKWHDMILDGPMSAVFPKGTIPLLRDNLKDPDALLEIFPADFLEFTSSLLPPEKHKDFGLLQSVNVLYGGEKSSGTIYFKPEYTDPPLTQESIDKGFIDAAGKGDEFTTHPGKALKRNSLAMSSVDHAAGLNPDGDRIAMVFGIEHLNTKQIKRLGKLQYVGYRMQILRAAFLLNHPDTLSYLQSLIGANTHSTKFTSDLGLPEIRDKLHEAYVNLSLAEKAALDRKTEGKLFKVMPIKLDMICFE